MLGWTGGYVLVAVLIAPYLRKFGAYTVPDFLAARFGGNLARFLGIIVLLAASFTYVVAQIRGTGLIAERFLGIPYNYAVFIGLAGILLCSMLGGMRAVTWTQVAQYIVLIVAYLIPVVIWCPSSAPASRYRRSCTADVLQQIQDYERQFGILGADGTVNKSVSSRRIWCRSRPMTSELLRPDLLPDDRHRLAAACV